MPLTKQIFHIAPSRIATVAAFLALVSAALVVGGWAAVVVDSAVRRRKMRPRRQVLRRVANEGPEQ